MAVLVLFFVLGVLANNTIGGVVGWNASFHPPEIEVIVDGEVDASILVRWPSEDESQDVDTLHWKAVAEPEDVLEAHLHHHNCSSSRNLCNLTLHVKGLFLGFGKVTLRDASRAFLSVTVLREDTLTSKVFIAFVATVVSLNNINMGCALDTPVVMDVLRKPIGPAIGFFCQFVIMPLVAYASGYLLMDDPVLRFGLFTMGSSPAGGASNMWTVLLGGNLDLSITMTFISTLAALGTVPFWLLTLGKTILEGTNIVVPYRNILMSLASLIVPIGIGLFIQRRFPKVAAKSKRILAPVSILLIICIVVMASIANTYMFYMLTWRMVLAAGVSVWTGFAAGAVISWLFRFPPRDIVAVCVETGIQNTGIAFVLLSYSLRAPVSDMASVVPVAASIMTPIPLFFMYCYQRLRNCCCHSKHFELKSLTSKSKDSIVGLDNPVLSED